MILHESNRMRFLMAAALFGSSAAVGCGSTPAPPELLDARAVYIRAESGPAAQYKPDQLHEAKVALDRAEQSYSDSPSKQKTRDLAYIAERKAELAESRARDAKTAQERTEAEKIIQQATQAQLSQTRAQLSQTGQQLAGTQQALAGTEQQLTAEKAARTDAEKKAREALDRLAASAAGSIKQETRGTVITIPGSVLFVSGKTSLLPNAQEKLTLVAEALKDQEGHQIVIEGHTDSQGTEDSNLGLSQGRAQAVLAFLVAHGVPGDRIRAQGLGQSRPVADNRSPEGRASNRRVEIIVQPGEKK